MIYTNKDIVKNWFYLLIVMVIGFFGVALFILISGNKLTKDATDSFYSYNIENTKEHIKTEVLNRIDEIEYERKNLLIDEKILLQDKINNIYSILINSESAKIEDPKERNIALISSYEQIVSEDEYLYFIIDTKGTMLRSGTDNDIIGTNIYDAQDIEGNYFTREIIKAKDKPNGIFVDYYWPKVKNQEALKKTSFCLYIPEFDFIIGTGVYHIDLQTQLQDKIYIRLQSYYNQKENYIFVNEFDSIARVSGDINLVGLNMSEQVDFDGKSIHNTFLSIIEDQGSGYHTYQFTNKDDKSLSEKISYIKEIEGWDAYIGMGFYIDELNEEVQNYSVLFKQHYYTQALYVIIGLVSISIVIFAIYQRGAFMQKAILRQGDLVFEQLFNLSNEAIIVLSSNGEVLYENDIATKLLYNNTKAYIKSNEIEFKKLTNSISTFKTDTDRVYFVNVRKEYVTYKGTASTIYFIDDITSDYINSNALEKMAYNDELTGLLNRRALSDNFEDYTYDLKEDENYILGIIDIDLFKEINDNYGHIKGDEVLKLLSNTIILRLRGKDSFYRYGGEEFIILLKNISLLRSKELLESLNNLCSSQIKESLDIKCTFSCGLTEVNYQNKHEALDTHVSKADRLLYKAKENGRNRIEI